ncbi:hypothetical protein GJ744_003081 [Endocarpon pusillum]|uniref:Uncharacterized protein n=1 Tax=Endocarpon pusillum TaxID=364733 RepID=A0A8H7AMK4_9EURO|nr:hypothetical protein GJ744_003081 [Endocarpon pusillum]
MTLARTGCGIRRGWLWRSSRCIATSTGSFRPTSEDSSNFALSIGEIKGFCILSGDGVGVDIHLIDPSSLDVVVFDLGNLIVKVIVAALTQRAMLAEFTAATGG